MTIAEQYNTYLVQITTRNRRPVKGATLAAYQSFWRTWIQPHLGSMDVAALENGVMKRFVAVLVDAGLSAASIASITNVVKGVVASATDDNGNELYPRKWNAEFIDMPVVEDQNAPTITAQDVSRAITKASSQYGPLFALLASSGARISEVLALKAHPEPNSSYWDAKQSKLVIRTALYLGKEQSPKTAAGIREVDLDPQMNEYLKVRIMHKDGFMFQSQGGAPLALGTIYDAKNKLGLPGLHSFRRFRITHLENVEVPRGLAMFWTGHAAKDVHEGYIKLDKDIKARKEWARRAGLGFSLPKESPKKSLTRQEEFATV